MSFDYLFEVSWEVANKIGGIYTVISEKANLVYQKYKNHYYLIGPYLEERGLQEVRLQSLPSKLQELENIARNLGLKIYFGEWLINGYPPVILIDFKNWLSRANEIKYYLWENHGVDSLRAGDDFTLPVVWSSAVGAILKRFLADKRAIVHSHEWLSGTVNLELLANNQVKTIFTTHATVLARSLAGAGIEFWKELSFIQPDQKAREFKIEAKHLLEKACAQKSDFLTTVSSLTQKEVEAFFGRKVDALLPNGINLFRFPTIEEITYAHRKNKEAIQKFLLYYFAPYYPVEIDDSLIYFISGRKEIKNKGIDIFIKALGLLDKMLTQANFQKQIFVFIFVPETAKQKINQEVMNNLLTYRSLEEQLEHLDEKILKEVLHSLIHQETLKIEDLFDHKTYLEITRTLKKLKKEKSPPLSIFDLPSNNEILILLKSANLLNQRTNKLKIIYYPTYLSSTDGFLNLTYYEAVSGAHLGVFPSFYEPWGYTPLETAAAGVATVTSDLSGFGEFIANNLEINPKFPGVFILKRKNQKEPEVIEDLAKIMFEFAQLAHSERVQNKLEARRIANFCTWEKLIENYFNLYQKI